MARKIILILILALIVPQVALAAWWNPLSWFDGWSFFKKNDSKKEILENRVKELEQKLEESSQTSQLSAPSIQSITETREPKSVEISAKRTTKQLNSIVPPPVNNTLSLEVEYKNLVIDYKKFESEVTLALDQLKPSRLSSPLQARRYEYVQGFLGELSYQVRMLRALTENQKVLSTLNSYSGKLMQLKGGYKGTLLDFEDELSAYFSAQQIETADSQEEDNYSDVDKQNKLNAINLQIANLNAKYVDDLKGCSGRGLTDVQRNACENNFTKIYTNDYNTLKAEYQQVLYSN